MLSVVIPAYNEELNIARCLDSLSSQTTRRKFEVIVVDNSSTDRTSQIIKKYKAKKFDLKVFSEKKKGRGAARSTGFAKSRGDIIFSTDADSLVPPNWIEQILKSFSDSKIVAVTGPPIILDCSLVTNLTHNNLYPVFMFIHKIIKGHFWLNGFNFAIKRNVYFESGGFNRSLNAQEDADLSHRVSRLGKIKYQNSVSVLYSGRRFSKGIIIGTIPYIRLLFHYYFVKEKVYLKDVR